ncbi:hypothetical protein F2Q70_00022152 [Brassica cretica]|uniref:Reverse transcriptase zinc-binding domain-containing protein n=1 Tax=Brassica cretica TaxID=69181 RepID=A0A8S9GVJ2_BRACR|nr:hypothetical protein F2Q70_00022152 [Brassica cretica]
MDADLCPIFDEEDDHLDDDLGPTFDEKALSVTSIIMENQLCFDPGTTPTPLSADIEEHYEKLDLIDSLPEMFVKISSEDDKQVQSPRSVRNRSIGRAYQSEIWRCMYSRKMASKLQGKHFLFLGVVSSKQTSLFLWTCASYQAIDRNSSFVGLVRHIKQQLKSGSIKRLSALLVSSSPFWRVNILNLATYLNFPATRLYILLNVTFASICRNETWQIPPAKTDNQLQLHTYLPTINLTQNYDYFEWEGLQLSSLCLLCNMTIESEDYLYHDYSYSFDLWSLSARRYGLTPFRDWSRTLAHNNRSAS